MDQWLVIGVSGVTCGGKTTLASNLYKYFRETVEPFAQKNLKVDRVHLISQDNYFLPVADARHVLIEHLNHINWEILSSIDMKRMCTDIMEVLGAKFMLYPTKQLHQDELMHVDDNLFSEHHHHHLPCSSTSSLSLAVSAAMQQDHLSASSVKSTQQLPVSNERHTPTSKLNILIIEGFLIFNDPFTLDLCNIKFHLHLPYERCYERRLKRVYEPPDVLGYFEMVVWPLYDQHCKEFAKRSDIMYLNGEVPRDKIDDFVMSTIKDQL